MRTHLVVVALVGVIRAADAALSGAAPRRADHAVASLRVPLRRRRQRRGDGEEEDSCHLLVVFGVRLFTAGHIPSPSHMLHFNLQGAPLACTGLNLAGPGSSRAVLSEYSACWSLRCLRCLGSLGLASRSRCCDPCVPGALLTIVFDKKMAIAASRGLAEASPRHRLGAVDICRLEGRPAL